MSTNSLIPALQGQPGRPNLPAFSAGTPTNPVLDEIHSHVASMSPGAQAAIKQALPMQGVSHLPDGGAVRSIAPITDPQAHPPVPPIGGDTQPGQLPYKPGAPLVGQQAQRSLDYMARGGPQHYAARLTPPITDMANPDPGGSLRPGGTTPPMPILPPHTAAQVMAPPPRGTIAGEENETSRLLSSGSGISQIKNPVGRGLAEFANDIGHIAVPGLMREVPGTEEHHEQLLGRAAGGASLLGNQRKTDTANDLQEAQTGEAQARTGLTQEQAAAFPEEQAQKQRLEDAQITNLLHPQAKTDFEAWRQQNPTAPVEDWIKAQGAPAREQAKELMEESLGQQAQLADESRREREQFHSDSEADRAAQRAQTAALAGNRMGAADKKVVYTAYQPAMDAADRFNTMTQNAIDALKDHNQQAMLSLLTNHIGMTLGAQKGARITKDILHEAQESTPWLQGVEAKFDSKDGLLSGVTLTPGQIRQMVGLAQQKYGLSVQRARNEAKYYGANDDGPERTPNQSTINYYKSLTGGDGQKAKAMAAADGWSVQ
jgi:hypothetical protein